MNNKQIILHCIKDWLETKNFKTTFTVEDTHFNDLLCGSSVNSPRTHYIHEYLIAIGNETQNARQLALAMN